MKQKQPAHVVKLGKIRVTIWENESKDQEVWFNAVLSRLYKTGDTWKDSTSLGHDDLPIAMKAIDMAYTWIWRKRAKLQKAERDVANKLLAKAGR